MATKLSVYLMHGYTLISKVYHAYSVWSYINPQISDAYYNYVCYYYHLVRINCMYNFSNFLYINLEVIALIVFATILLLIFLVKLYNSEL